MQWEHPCGRADHYDGSYDDRAGMDVPGYTGYIAGKVPEMDVVGQTFAEVNKHVNTNDRTVSGPLGIQAAPRNQDPPPRRDPFPGGAVPGYMGYIPGKVPEADVFGKTYADTSKHVLKHGRPPAGRGDRNLGYKAPPPKNADVAAAREKVPGVAHAMVSVPGYTGFVPAKTSENVYGAGHCHSNYKAADEFHRVTYRGEGFKPTWRRTSAPGVEERQRAGAGKGIEIPGYSGHTPGKHPEADMMGMTFAVVNKHADRNHQYRRGHHPGDSSSCASSRGTRHTASTASYAQSIPESRPSTARSSGGRSARHSDGSGTSYRQERPRTAPSDSSSRRSGGGSSAKTGSSRSGGSSRYTGSGSGSGASSRRR